jgi:uncharacterized membrane protein YcgQ (UPF0703/DUF1980 family)
MNQKLTLSLDKAVIEKAKKYAKSNQESLSHLVENYFRYITDEVKEAQPEYAPEVIELLGSISAPEDVDTEELKKSYLEDKYLND